MYIKLNKKQLINKVVKLTKDKNNLLDSANLKGETILNQQDNYDKLQKDYDDMVKVQQPIVYNYPNSNGVSTNGTITTTSNTIYGN